MKCRYCKEEVGFLGIQHGPCRTAHVVGLSKITRLAAGAAIGARPLDNFMSDINEISASAFISYRQIRDTLTDAWMNAAKLGMADEPISKDKVIALQAFAKSCRLDLHTLKSAIGRTHIYESVYQDCIAWMLESASDTAIGKKPLDNLMSELDDLGANSIVPKDEIRYALVFGWFDAAIRAIDDDIPSESEQTSLQAFIGRFNINDNELEWWEHGLKARRIVKQSNVIRELRNGKFIETYDWGNSHLPFNFIKSETPVWAFLNVRYTEDGAKEEDAGALALTTQHIYFAGESKSFRVPFDAIVTFNPYSNGLGITQDSENANRQYFLTDEDSWFVGKLAKTLANQT